MDLQARRREQSRHQRLGRLILVTAVIVAIILASLIMAFAPPVPLLASLAFYAIAVVIAGAVDRGLRRLFGYDREKASLRYLRPDNSASPNFLSTAGANPPSPDSNTENNQHRL